MADSLIGALCAALMLVLMIGSTSTPADRARVEAEQRRELDAIVKKNRAAFEATHDIPGPADPVKKCVNDCHGEHCDCHMRCAEVSDPLYCADRCNSEEKTCQKKCEVFQSMVPR